MENFRELRESASTFPGNFECCLLDNIDVSVKGKSTRDRILIVIISTCKDG